MRIRFALCLALLPFICLPITIGHAYPIVDNLTIDDIANESRFDAKGSSNSFVGMYGDAQLNVSPPGAFKDSDSDHVSSVTVAGVSGGNITITNEAAQQQRTGQTAEEAIASTNRNVLTGQDTNSLSKDWDVNELVDRMKAETEITAAFVKESGAFAANQAKAVDNARKELETTTDPQRRQELQTFIEKNSIWDTGGIGRLAVTAINAALSGNASGASADVLRDATVNVLQGLAAQEVKALVEGNVLSEEARAALHAIVGCAGAAAQSSSCSTAALGAAGNVVLNNLIYGTDVDASKLSAQERENRINLLNSIITGVTLAVGGDSAMASAAAKIEAENNALSISNVDRVYTAIQQCLGNQSCRTEDLRKEFEDKEAEYLKTVINNCYGAGATVSTCRSSASALGTSIQHLDALRAQLRYNNATPAEAQALAYVMYLWEDSTALLEDINKHMPTVDIPTQLNQIRDQLQEGETGFWETASSVTGVYLTTTGFGTGGGNRSSRNRPRVEGGKEQNLSVPRQGNITIEPLARPNADELRAGQGFINQGYDVTYRATANDQGVQGVRTSDLWVNGGKVDVYTPRATNTSRIVGMIEKKNSQTNAVLVQGDFSRQVQQEIVNRTWGKPTARNIDTIYFQGSDGKIIRIDRPSH